MEHNDVCDLCQLGNIEDSTPCIVLQDLLLMIASSKRRGDEKWKHWQNISTITVHDRCYLDYLSIPNDADTEQSYFSTSVNEVEGVKEERVCIQLDKNCIFCGKTCDEALEKKKCIKNRRRMDTIKENSGLREEIENYLKIVDDDWSKAVRNRIMHKESLTGSKYHYLCKLNFLSRTGNKERGRPVIAEYQDGIQKVYNLLDNFRDCQYSLEYLMEKMACDMCDTHLKDLLKKKYGNDIIISSYKNHKSIVTFKDHEEQILSQYYERDKSTSDNNDVDTVKRAGQIICEDIHAMSSVDGTDDTVPQSLKTFLDGVILKQKKKARRGMYSTKIHSIAHTIIASTTM